MMNSLLAARLESGIIILTSLSPRDLAMWIDRLVRLVLPRQESFFDRVVACLFDEENVRLYRNGLQEPR